MFKFLSSNKTCLLSLKVLSNSVLTDQTYTYCMYQRLIYRSISVSAFNHMDFSSIKSLLSSIKNFSLSQHKRKPAQPPPKIIEWPKPEGGKSYLNVKVSDRDILDMTVPQVFDKCVEKYGENEALYSAYQNVRRTFNELKNEVDAFGAGLLKLGLVKGDRVIIWGPKSYEWIVVQLAVFNAGFVLVNLNSSHRLNELHDCLKLSGASALVMSEEVKHHKYYAKVKKLVPEVVKHYDRVIKSEMYPNLKRIITISREEYRGCFRFQQVIQEGMYEKNLLDRARRDIKSEDLCNIQFTSGTTGAPKAIMVDHKGLVNTSYYTGLRLEYSDTDKQLILPQLHHCKVSNALLAAYHFGTTTIIPGQYYHSQDAIKYILKERCSIVYGTPTMHMDILYRLKSDDDISAFKSIVTMCDFCPLWVLKNMFERYCDANVYNIYGLTEICPMLGVCLTEDEDDIRETTVGYPLDNMEVKIIGKNNEIVENGEEGELWIRGFGTMHKYWKDSENQTKFTDDDGWFNTEDIFTMTESGHLKVIGRSSDLIIRGGENIYPKEIENFIYQDSRIAEVHCFSVPDLRFGEDIAVWVKVKPGKFVKSDEIKKAFIGKLASYKIPRYVMFGSASLPKDESGKVKKKYLKEETIKFYKISIK